jgi:hypothetical protein
MLLRRLINRVRSQDWFAVAIEIVVLVLGIVLGLQATNWADTRRERAEEHDSLERLLADGGANRAELRRAADADRLAAAQILSISQALEDSAAMPDPGALSDRLCRWFVHPEIHLQRATYAELVSSGRLLLIRDQSLRAQLALEDAAHMEARHLDVLIPAIQRAAESIDPFRSWYIDATQDEVEARCRFDIAGMRRDPSVASALAQLYRHQLIYAEFRQSEINAVEATQAMLLTALGRKDEASVGDTK